MIANELNYYGFSNPALLGRLPPDARLVVEAGCGTGALCRDYKRINPHVRYVGIEQISAAAAVAAEHLDHVVNGDVEHLPDTALPFEPGTVDALVYGDVLEHLIDPWAVLKRHAGWLAPGGLVIACIPNMVHWSALVHFLMGEWPHLDSGLFDRTHLRFFTLDSIRKLFDQAELSILDVGTVSNTTAETEPKQREFLRLILPFIERVGIEPKGFSERTLAFQYVVRAIKAPTRPRALSIQSLLSASPSARVRMIEPDAYLSTIPGMRIESAYQSPDLSKRELDQEKVFVLQRAALPREDCIRRQRALLQNGYLTIAELDEDPDRWPAHRDKMHFLLRTCHAVQTPTKALADLLREFNPNLAVFANQIARLPPRPLEKTDGPLTLFFGALNRQDDWQPIMPALNHVLSAHREQVRVKVMQDSNFFIALATDNKEFVPACDYDAYQEGLRGMDIGLLPLLPTRLNSIKSDILLVEYAAHGMSVLASPTVYEASIEEGRTGMLYRTPEEFEEKLTRLITQPELRRQLGNNSYEWVRDQRLLGQHYRERRNWYLDLRDRLPELNAQLKARVPELFY